MNTFPSFTPLFDYILSSQWKILIGDESIGKERNKVFMQNCIMKITMMTIRSYDKHLLTLKSYPMHQNQPPLPIHSSKHPIEPKEEKESIIIRSQLQLS